MTLGGQRRRRRRAVPGLGGQPVAQGLLVEGRRRVPGDHLVGRPQARRVGRAHLVAQAEHAVDVAELELGVGQNEADVGRPRRGPGVELEADVARRRRRLGAHQVDRLGEVDVDVVPLRRLGRRGEHGLGQAVGQLEAGRHGRSRAPCPTSRTPRGPGRPDSRGRCTRSAASRPGAPARPGRPTRAGTGRGRASASMSSGSAASSVPGTTSDTSSHQKTVMAVSTRPLLAIGSAMITSKALTRSEATMSRRSSPAS